MGMLLHSTLSHVLWALTAELALMFIFLKP